MSEIKKIVVEIFKQNELSNIKAIALNAVNVLKSNDEIISDSAKMLGDNPTYDRWIGFFEHLTTFIKESKGVSLGRASNIIVEIKKELKEQFELVAPKCQNDKALKSAENRAKKEKAFQEKYGTLDLETLQAMVPNFSNDTKSLLEIGNAMAKLTNTTEKENAKIAKEKIKSSMEAIKNWLTKDLSVDEQVKRTTAVLNFINSKN